MNRIKELRAQRGMKQSELAESLKVSRTAISNYEAEIREIDAPTIRALCGIFGCTSDYLLGISELRTPDLAVEEQELIAAWRKAPKEIRAIINTALAPYREDGIESSTA